MKNFLWRVLAGRTSEENRHVDPAEEDKKAQIRQRQHELANRISAIQFEAAVIAHRRQAGEQNAR